MVFPFSYYPPGCSGPPDPIADGDCQGCNNELDTEDERYCSVCLEAIDEDAYLTAAEQRADAMSGLW